MQPTIIQPNNQSQPVASEQPAVQPTAPYGPDPMAVAEPAAVVPSQPPTVQPVVATPDTSQLFAPDVPPTAEPAGKSLNVAKPAIVALVAIALVAVGYFANVGMTSMAQNNAKSTAEAFIANVNSNNTTKAYRMTSANLRSSQSESQFADAMSGLNTTNPSFGASDFGVNGGRAVYNVTENNLPATDDGSTTGYFSVSLVRNGLTGWKVDSVLVN